MDGLCVSSGGSGGSQMAAAERTYLSNVLKRTYLFRSGPCPMMMIVCPIVCLLVI